MQNYLHIGGGKDSLSFPAPDDAETVTWPVGVTDKETYTRATLNLAGVAIMVYAHESLPPEQALNHLVKCYKALGCKYARQSPLRHLGTTFVAFRGGELPTFNNIPRRRNCTLHMQAIQ